MKLNDDFILSKVGKYTYIIPTASNSKGILSINDTAEFIVECLKEDTTKENILEKMKAEYDVDNDRLSSSIDTTLESLRNIGALIE